jgi:DivIVA domain-containing protein
MVLLPDEITNRNFSTVLGRGYDRREVDDFLMQVAASYKGAIEKIALVATGNQSTEDFSDEVELILRPARESAEEIVREAAEKTAGMHKAAAQRAAELEAEALERAKRIVEEAQENADRRLEESRLQVARAEQAMHEGLAERVAELEASGPLPRPDVALVRPSFREASQSGRPGRGRQTLILVGFGKALLSGLLIAEILYVLIAYFR